MFTNDWHTATDLSVHARLDAKMHLRIHAHICNICAHECIYAFMRTYVTYILECTRIMHLPWYMELTYIIYFEMLV